MIGNEISIRLKIQVQPVFAYRQSRGLVLNFVMSVPKIYDMITHQRTFIKPVSHTQPFQYTRRPRCYRKTKSTSTTARNNSAFNTVAGISISRGIAAHWVRGRMEQTIFLLKDIAELPTGALAA
ncbi:hypothetical protein EVAR_8938_1 [Eumeta japonica]|uniref:Uncharacterized protein n=1 Tax=Eumeta variegata TaxID=151549 RepID=A0A4C1U0P0_EUMVA|nr:hypothetical protein EVAR_8938_1 [Eumeta japonica]